MALVVGVDSSTQSTKVEVRNVGTGTIVASASAPHPPTEPPTSEQPPTAWWLALVATIEQLGDHRRHVAAISVAGQQHGLVLLDDAGTPLRPAKLWNDTMSAPQATALVERLGTAEWAERCGSVPVAAFTITKLAWVAEHEPEIIGRIAKLMLPHDYLTWRLTGRHVTDRGDASGTGWFDPTTSAYRPELLAEATANTAANRPSLADHLPDVLGPTEAAGQLSEPAAAELGLPPTTIVGPGTGDNMAAALGLGLRPGDVVLSLGTSGTVYSVSETPTNDSTGAVAGFADATGRFLPLVCTLNATKVTDTVASWLGTDAAGLAQLALAAATNEAGEADDVADLPVLVPYFDGERTPNLPEATGRFVGLRTSTTREQIALAAHDGVLCGLLDGVDALRSAGVTADGSLHLVGGGARSVAYQQRLADLSGRSVKIPVQAEAVATGAAVQAAAVATGSSLADVSEAWSLDDAATVEPHRDSSPRRAAYRAATVE